MGRREELLLTAAELFADKGFRATTVRDIAAVANIQSGSLYHHFDSKESMLEEILCSFVSDLETRYKSVTDQQLDPIATLSGLVRESILIMADHRPAIAIYQKEGHGLDRERFAEPLRAAEQVERAWVDALVEGQRRGMVTTTVDAQMIYRYLRDVIWMAAHWLRDEGPLSFDEVSDRYLTLILHGLTGPGGQTDLRTGRPVRASIA